MSSRLAANSGMSTDLVLSAVTSVDQEASGSCDNHLVNIVVQQSSTFL